MSRAARVVTATIVVFLTVSIGADEPRHPSPVYAVEAVDGRVVRLSPPPEARVAAGERLQAGAVIRTGWWSSARVVAEGSAARFEVGPRTTVRLAADRPGLLLVVERGRVRALFGPLGAGDESARLVETPSAVLAVRGTEYGVAVDRDGATRVVVFEGVVEVRDRGGRHPPVAVRAGELSEIRPGGSPTAPSRHRMGPDGWDRGRMPGSPSSGGGSAHGRDGSRPGPGGTHHDRPPQGNPDAAGTTGGGTSGHGG